MIILSQRHPIWTNQKIGQTNLTVGRYGCTITCLSMLTDYAGKFSSPRQLAQEFKFTKDGLILWDSLAKVTPLRLLKRLYKKDDATILEGLKGPKKAVILEVDYSHWVVALKALPFGIYWIADPWDGKKKFSTAYKKITGLALIGIS